MLSLRFYGVCVGFLIWASGIASAKGIEAQLFGKWPDFYSQKYKGQKAERPKASLLQEARAAQKRKHFKTCLSRLEEAQKKIPVLRPWIEIETLECHRQQFLKQPMTWSEPMGEALSKLEGAYLKLVDGREVYAKAYRDNFENAFVTWMEKVSQHHPKVSLENLLKKEKLWRRFIRPRQAQLSFLRGELHLKKGQRRLALKDWERSLDLEASPSKEKRVNRLRKQLKIESVAADVVPSKAEVVEPLVSAAEEALWERFNGAYKAKDYLAAAEDGVQFLRSFPNSSRHEAVQVKILAFYRALTGSKDDRLKLVRNRVLDILQKAPSVAILFWAQEMNYKEQFLDAIALAETQLESKTSDGVGAQILLLVSKSFLNIAEFKKAQSLLKLLVEKHSRSEVWPEALFKHGLLSYRLGDYPAGVESFRKYLNIQDQEDYDLSSMYWLWRSLDKLGQKLQAENARQELLGAYPTSYYALRALNHVKGDFSFFKNDEALAQHRWTPNLSADQEKSWQRMWWLAHGLWLEEAKRELQSLPVPEKPENLLVWSRLWASFLDLPRALRGVSEAWGKDPKLSQVQVFEYIYPRYFGELIGKETKRYSLNDNLILSLIRQESSFRVDVRSPAGALGLMQILPSTAREIARDIRIKSFSARTDLLKPDLNIKIGVNYIYRLIRAFDGHVPMALAAYNAGIGNIRGWLAHRKDLKLDELSLDDPDSEIWVDELPWLETSGYVKNILRNWLIYRHLDQSQNPIVFPVWKTDISH